MVNNELEPREEFETKLRKELEEKERKESFIEEKLRLARKEGKRKAKKEKKKKLISMAELKEKVERLKKQKPELFLSKKELKKLRRKQKIEKGLMRAERIGGGLKQIAKGIGKEFVKGIPTRVKLGKLKPIMPKKVVGKIGGSPLDAPNIFFKAPSPKNQQSAKPKNLFFR